MQRVKLLIISGILLLSAFILPVNAQQLVWDVESGSYQYSMVINAEIRKDGGVLPSQQNYTVGVFDRNGKCRGKNTCKTTSTGRLHFPLTVYGNVDGEELVFKARRTDLQGEVMDFDQVVKFQSDYILGDGDFFVLSENVPVQLAPDPDNGGSWVVYVSPNGSSSGVSNLQPAGDIGKALLALQQSPESGPKTLLLMGGVYTLKEPILILPGIHIRAYQNDVVRLDGRHVNRVLQTQSALQGVMSRSVSPTTTIENVIIQNGLATGNGGGAYVDNSVSFKNCIFKENRSSTKGGGLFGGQAVGCLFQGNNAVVSANAACNAILEQSTVVRNGSQSNISVLENVTLTHSVVWGNSSSSVVGGRMVRSAIEGEGHSGDKVIFLSSSNTDNNNQLLAPRFVNVTNGMENWALNEYSPLSKLIDSSSDLGAYQSNRKGVVFPSISIAAEKVEYGKTLIPVTEIKNAFGEIVSGVIPVVSYCRADASQWYTEPPTARGNYKIKCEIQPNQEWTQAPGFVAEATIEITPRILSITANQVTCFYGENQSSLTYTLSGELLSGDVISGELCRDQSENKSVGRYQIKQGTLTASDNYTIIYQPADYIIAKRPIIIQAKPVEKLYFDADPELEYTVVLPENIAGLTGQAVIEKDIFTGKLERENISPLNNIGDYPIRLGTLALNDNYDITYLSSNLTIKPRPITIKAFPTNQTYGDAPAKITYEVIGELVNANTLSGELSRENVLSNNVGAYNITLGTLAVHANAMNYTITLVTNKYNIIQRHIEITADEKTITYGEPDPQFTYNVTAGNLVNGDVITGKLQRVAGKDIGAYTIEQGTLAISPNYAISYIPKQMNIELLPITVTVDAQQKMYGEKDPELTYKTDRRLIGDDKFLGTIQRVTGESVGTYKIEQGSLLLSKNYQVTFEPANLIITRREISIKANSYNKGYGEKDPKFTYTIGLSGMAFNDELNGSLVRIAGENVGDYVIEQGSLTANNNYTIKTFEKGNLTITPAPVEIILDNLTHVYDRNKKEVTVITRPVGLPVKVTYNGSLTPPSEIGRYTVVAVIDNNFHGEIVAEMVISSPEIENNLKATKVLSRSSGDPMTFRMEFEELVKENKLVFFDVRGKVIFEQANYRSGEFDMSHLSAGTYYYVFTFTKPDGTRHVQKKFVEIIP